MGGCYFRSIVTFIKPKRTERKLTFIDGTENSDEQRKIAPMHIEPGLYLSIVDVVMVMNDKVQKRIDAQKFDYKGNHVSVF